VHPNDPSFFEEGPDDPDEDAGTSPQGGLGGGADELSSSGWVPPTERFWRHPSELAGGGNAASSSVEPSQAASFPGRQRTRAATTVVLGAAAVVVVGVILLFAVGTDSSNDTNTESVSITQTTGTLTSGTSSIASVPAVARTAAEAIVPLEVNSASGSIVEDGVAVAEGGLIATCADSVKGATSITMAGPDGKREKASVIAVDTASNVALLHVPSDPPVAHFSDDASTSTGSEALAVAVAPRTGQADAVTWKITTVAAVGTTLGAGGPSTMAGLGAGTATTPAIGGELLLSPKGEVLGVLDASAMSSSAASPAYLPADVVLGVADQLAQSGRVQHGWLDVGAADPSGGGGAEVVSVESSGVSAGHLQVGDLITAVDGAPVRTTAELRSRLYVLAPGAPVELVVQRAGTQLDVSVDLGASP